MPSSAAGPPGKHGGFSGFVLNADDPDRGGPGRGGLNDLAERLRADGVTHLTVVGLAADVCVAATARDARRLGYEVTIPLSATAFVHAHPAGDDAALADLTAAGVTITDRGPRQSVAAVHPGASGATRQMSPCDGMDGRLLPLNSGFDDSASCSWFSFTAP